MNEPIEKAGAHAAPELKQAGYAAVMRATQPMLRDALIAQADARSATTYADSMRARATHMTCYDQAHEIGRLALHVHFDEDMAKALRASFRVDLDDIAEGRLTFAELIGLLPRRFITR
jgi:hypothetical protein